MLSQKKSILYPNLDNNWPIFKSMDTDMAHLILISPCTSWHFASGFYCISKGSEISMSSNWRTDWTYFEYRSSRWRASSSRTGARTRRAWSGARPPRRSSPGSATRDRRPLQIKHCILWLHRNVFGNWIMYIHGVPSTRVPGLGWLWFVSTVDTILPNSHTASGKTVISLSSVQWNSGTLKIQVRWA